MSMTGISIISAPCNANRERWVITKMLMLRRKNKSLPWSHLGFCGPSSYSGTSGSFPRKRNP